MLPGATPSLKNRKVQFQGQIVRLPSGDTSGYGFFILGESAAATAQR
ncbi:MAG TPA: hypothetical protein VD994_08120 [Prosthecobacter sp.]|nr:hypothetical protein [Prosthecobacter sp.]